MTYGSERPFVTSGNQSVAIIKFKNWTGIDLISENIEIRENIENVGPFGADSYTKYEIITDSTDLYLLVAKIKTTQSVKNSPDMTPKLN